METDDAATAARTEKAALAHSNKPSGNNGDTADTGAKAEGTATAAKTDQVAAHSSKPSGPPYAPGSAAAINTSR